MEIKELLVKAKTLGEVAVDEKEFAEYEAKANEVMNTGATNFGKEIIPTNVMLDDMLDMLPNYSSLINIFPGNHGTNMPVSAKVPVIGEANLFKGNSEWTTGAGSFITPANNGPMTDEVTITQGQYILTVSLSKRELNYGPAQLEAIIKDRINRAAARTIDAVILNGDSETGTTGNVNSDDAAPTSGIYYLQNDHGIREIAINNSQTVDCGTLDAGDFLTVKAQLGEGYQADLTNLVYLTNASTYNKMLALSEVITMDKFGADATIVKGALAKVFGTDIVVVRDFPNTEADGKVSATASNNTKGGFACVYKPAVQYGFGQPLEIDAYKVPGKGVDLVATFEFGFAIANNVAGLGKTVAMGINVTL